MHCRRYSIVISYKTKIIKSKRHTTLVILQLKKKQQLSNRCRSKVSRKRGKIPEKENLIHCRRLWRQTSFQSKRVQVFIELECKCLANLFVVIFTSELVLFYFICYFSFDQPRQPSLPFLFLVLVMRTMHSAYLFILSSFTFLLPVKATNKIVLIISG